MSSQCCGSTGCCSSTNSPSTKKKVVIDFLYLDLSQCDWCQGTEENLDNAVAKVNEVLKMTGVELMLNKIHVSSEELADQLGFTTSPTIRINGKDIQLDYKESQCAACSDLCGNDVECRVWLYQGREYTAPPEGMIIEAILREVYGTPSPATSHPKTAAVSLNLKKFFKGIRK